MDTRIPTAVPSRRTHEVDHRGLRPDRPVHRVRRRHTRRAGSAPPDTGLPGTRSGPRPPSRAPQTPCPQAHFMRHTPTMEIAAHLTHLRQAGQSLADFAEAAGPDAPVPTCPDWQVHDLVRHTGAVHLWATAFVAEGTSRPGLWRTGLTWTGPSCSPGTARRTPRWSTRSRRRRTTWSAGRSCRRRRRGRSGRGARRTRRRCTGWTPSRRSAAPTGRPSMRPWRRTASTSCCAAFTRARAAGCVPRSRGRCGCGQRTRMRMRMRCGPYA